MSFIDVSNKDDLKQMIIKRITVKQFMESNPCVIVDCDGEIIVKHKTNDAIFRNNYCLIKLIRNGDLPEATDEEINRRMNVYAMPIMEEKSFFRPNDRHLFGQEFLKFLKEQPYYYRTFIQLNDEHQFDRFIEDVFDSIALNRL